MQSAPGFFGKVSTHGDFVSRRIPPAFLEVWDNWLQQAMHTSKEQLDIKWLETYLTSPIWRFALSNGVVDEHAWAGVLMPSVDRVGRHFPLMIAAGVAGQAPLLQWMSNGETWYDELEELALSSLGNQFLLESFDAALQEKSGLPVLSRIAETVADQHVGWCLPINDLTQLKAGMPGLTNDIAQKLLMGHSLWWTNGSPCVQPSALVCRGLPAPSSFAAMLDGSWIKYGWQLPV